MSTPVEPKVRKGPGWMLTTVGALIVFGIVVVLNFLAAKAPARIDWTANKSHSLTTGTKNILGRVDTPVTLKLFVTEKDAMPQAFAPVVEEALVWLARYKEMKPDLINIENYEVKPATDAEQAASASGLQPNRGLWFGITVTCLDKTATIPWVPELLSLAGQEEDRIEYFITRSISEVTRPSRKRIGLLTPLKVAGNNMPFGGNQSPEWEFHKDLKSQYDIKTLEMTVKTIETTEQNPKEGVDVLVLIHPAGITDETQYAIDQYLLNGGRVVAFLDAYSYMASQSGGQDPRMPAGMSPGAIETGSNLSHLLSTWGYSFDSTKIVADKGSATPFSQSFSTPILLTLGQDRIGAKDDPIVKQLTNFWFIFSGGYAGSPASGLHETKYLTTTVDHQLVGTQYASVNPQSPEGQNQFAELERKFQPEGKERILALRLEGTFKTGFPEGKPAPKPSEPKPAGGGFPGGLPGGFGNGPEGAKGPEGAAAQPGAPPADPPAAPAEDKPKPEETPPAKAADAPPARRTGTAAPPAKPAETSPPKPGEVKPAKPVEAVTPPISIPPAPPDPTPGPAPVPAPGLLPSPLPATPAAPAATPATPPAPAAPPAPADTSLKESKKPGLVYLVADSDMLCLDLITRQTQENGNIAMALNMVDEAANDPDLMAVRSRGAAIRPFTKLNKIKEAAEKKIRPDLEKLNQEQERLVSNINTAKTAKERNAAFYNLMRETPKQQQEVKLKMYELQKAARKEIDAEVNAIKWKNVLIPPSIIALIGIGVFVSRHFRTAAV